MRLGVLVIVFRKADESTVQIAGGLYVNGKRSNVGETLDPNVDFLGGKLCLMRVGQKKWGVLETA